MFTGVGRRFEHWGEENGVDVVHDYAHHPTEVRVTLEAARRALPGVPLHVLFQPHQFSRTARFLEEFCESLRAADRVVVTDVYGARAHIDGSRFAGSAEVVEGLRARRVQAELGGGLARSVEIFLEGLPSPAAALVLGAGDIETIRDDLLDDRALRSAAQRRPIP
jgi:UDP-N-acetylmuramate--alanine ligase